LTCSYWLARMHIDAGRIPCITAAKVSAHSFSVTSFLE
jgi:hypothetical protein